VVLVSTSVTRQQSLRCACSHIATADRCAAVLAEHALCYDVVWAEHVAHGTTAGLLTYCYIDRHIDHAMSEPVACVPHSVICCTAFYQERVDSMCFVISATSPLWQCSALKSCGSEWRVGC
jgi:hypothetical protein